MLAIGSLQRGGLESLGEDDAAGASALEHVHVRALGASAKALSSSLIRTQIEKVERTK